MKKLEFESEEIEKKLESEMERATRLRQDKADLEAQMDANKQSFQDEVHRLKGAIKAEEQIAAGL
jgi:hypothetical protein